MGWISDRHMKRGGSIGPGGLGADKRGAPLRKVVANLTGYLNMFQADTVLLECGHEGKSWGGSRARCVKCKQLAAAAKGNI
jgi:hypothetical protein